MIDEGAAEAASRESAPELMTGFPPTPDSQVTLANWQEPPFNRWAFRHMREIIPSQPIPAGATGPGGPAPLPAAPGPLPDPPVWRLDSSTATAAEVFAGTYTDALVVLHDGQLVAERYDAGMIAATPHLLMSVSKSIVGCVAARSWRAGDGLRTGGRGLGIRRRQHPQPARYAHRGSVP
jgi:CubicO group peptidase (beta-lactamase class C family)